MSDQPSNDDKGSGPFWDFINNHVPMDDIQGPQSQDSGKLQPAVQQESADNPLQNYLPHNHKDMWKMLQLGKDRSHPEKVAEAERFFNQCPDGSCRQALRDVMRNIGFYAWRDDEYETYDGL